MRIAVPVCFCLVACAAVAAPVLTPQCETALARSALPERLRSQASVVGLTSDGYREIAASTGPFTCIVERNHPDALIPQCVDAAGADTIIPAIVWRSEQMLAGSPAATVKAEFKRRAERGEFRAPARAGLSYMVSDFNYIFIPERGEITKVHPHLMFYAPGLENEDIGGSFAAARENRGLPFVLEPGIHGYMITFVDQPSERGAVIEACSGEIDPRWLTSS